MGMSEILSVVKLFVGGIVIAVGPELLFNLSRERRKGRHDIYDDGSCSCEGGQKKSKTKKFFNARRARKDDAEKARQQQRIQRSCNE